MESREIYNRTRKTLQWEDNWIHIGTSYAIKFDLIHSIILKHFGNQNNIMIKRGRTNSQKVENSSVFEVIKDLIGTEDFELWDKQFNRAIKFNKIGVINISQQIE